MPTVSNTSPILNLAIVGHIALLREQFGEIIIPPAVLAELRVDDDLSGSENVRAVLKAGWLRVAQFESSALVRVLERDLDRGEAEAIAVAIELNAEHILLDEREGRRIAKTLGLTVSGVLGVLVKARLDGRLPSLREAREALRTQAGFRIGGDLFSELVAFDDS